MRGRGSLAIQCENILRSDSHIQTTDNCIELLDDVVRTKDQMNLILAQPLIGAPMNVSLTLSQTNHKPC